MHSANFEVLIARGFGETAASDINGVQRSAVGDGDGIGRDAENRGLVLAVVMLD